MSEIKIQSKEIQLVNINTLTPHPKNMNKHDDAQIDRLCKIIEYQGFRNPLMVQKGTNLVVAGHGRIMAAKKLGLSEVPVIYQEFESEEQLYAAIVSDNSIASWAELDLAMVNSELENLGPDLDIDLLGIKDFVIEPIEKYEDGCDEDEVPEVINPITKRGDVWLLGEHRVMCGDSTMIDDVEKLMKGEKVDMVFTDPPYGVSATGGRSQTVDKLNIKKIANDELRGDNLENFIIDALSLIPLKPNASFYVCYDRKTQHEFTGALKAIDWTQRDTIIWNKNVFGLSGGKGYRPKFEMVAFGYVGETYNWHGDKSQADVWDIKRPRERFGNHPTPKPVELIEKALKNSSKAGDLVTDVFTGSGSTLIACEKLNRKFYGIELDENYCDVIVQRWQEFTGQIATLESTGETYNSLKGSSNE